MTADGTTLYGFAAVRYIWRRLLCGALGHDDGILRVRCLRCGDILDERRLLRLTGHFNHLHLAMREVGVSAAQAARNLAEFGRAYQRATASGGDQVDALTLAIRRLDS